MTTWTTEKLLAVIKANGMAECVNEARLVELTGYCPKQVENACGNLRRHGFIERTGQGCHRLTKAGAEAMASGYSLRAGPRGPQQSGQRRRAPGMRQRIWNCLRMGKKLTVDDIVMLVLTGDERDPKSNVAKYLAGLRKAGYLMLLRKEAPLNPTSNGANRWMLVSDTGPIAPVIRATRKVIYDPNLDAEIAMQREAS